MTPKIAATLATPTDPGNVAHVRHSQIIELKASLNRNAIMLGAALAEMRDHELYCALGYSTFEDYLVSATVAINRATAYRFMRIYQTFRETQDEAARLDWGKLDILTRIIRDDDPPERILPLLAEAAAMPREELRHRVNVGKQQRMIAPPVVVEARPAAAAPPPARADPWGDEADEIAPPAPTPLYPQQTAPEWPRQPVAAPYQIATTPDPAYAAPTLHRVPVDDDDPADDGEGRLSSYQLAILGKYTHLVEDMLAVAYKHRDMLAAIDPAEIAPITTRADEEREASVLRICDWFARKGAAAGRPVQLRRVP